MDLINSFFEALIVGSIIYFFFVNSFYLFLMVASVKSLYYQSKMRPLTEAARQGKMAFAAPISILAPAYNEQATVVDSVKSFLLLRYPSFEVIVINDGSKDGTLKCLQEAFMLDPVPIIYDDHLSTTKVRGVYVSRLHPNLKVVDKVNGGKADALNIGIGFARHELFCAVDSDSLLDEEALLKVAAPFFENPALTVASGGTVRIANGAHVRFGRVESVKLPANPLVLMQIIEYTRAFLCGRIGWNTFNATLVISGAFGLFSKKAVKEIGGYKKGSVGEDMELIVALHRYHRSRQIPYSVVFVADPVCWTEAPTNRLSLSKQRDRWQRGLAETIFKNRDMMLNPKYGFIGLMAMPYFFMVDLLGPLFELGSFLVILLALFMGGFDTPLFIAFFLASILYSAALSMCSIVIEEIYFSKYNRPLQFATLFMICLLESVWYRQISTYWRLKGLIKYLRGDNSWGHLQRAGFTKKG